MDRRTSVLRAVLKARFVGVLGDCCSVKLVAFVGQRYLAVGILAVPA